MKNLETFVESSTFSHAINYSRKPQIITKEFFIFLNVLFQAFKFFPALLLKSVFKSLVTSCKTKSHYDFFVLFLFSKVFIWFYLAQPHLLIFFFFFVVAWYSFHNIFVLWHKDRKERKRFWSNLEEYKKRWQNSNS